jgi:hypothetical protein
MKIKPSIALVMLSTLLLSFAMQSLADKATASVKNKSLAEETPHITNEAEYAEFVKRREGAGHASSAKSTRSMKSSSAIHSRTSIKYSLSSAASFSHSKTLIK